MFKRKKLSLCDNCAKLRSKLGREYKCHYGHGPYTCFKRAPSYCANFVPRKENEDALN